MSVQSGNVFPPRRRTAHGLNQDREWVQRRELKTHPGSLSGWTRLPIGKELSKAKAGEAPLDRA